jgi:hypothetical protein
MHKELIKLHGKKSNNMGFCGTGIWAQDFTLAKQALYCLSHTSSPFALVIVEMGYHELFCLGWSWKAIVLISASQVARIIDLSHWHLALNNLI